MNCAALAFLLPPAHWEGLTPDSLGLLVFLFLSVQNRVAAAYLL